MSDAETLYSLGFALVLVGILIIILAFLVLFFSSTKKDGKTKGEVLLILGPFPIAFGTDHESTKTLLALSIILTILLIIVTMVVYMVSR